MGQVWSGVLAKAKVPVGMACPLHSEIVPEIEVQPNILADELIHDGAVIDALNRDTFAVTMVEKPVPFPLDVRNAHRADAAETFREPEVGKCFLAFGMDLHQHHVGWIVAAENC